MGIDAATTVRGAEAVKKDAVPDRVTYYARWQQGEGIRKVTGFIVPDLRAVELDYWARMNAYGAFLEMDGIEEGQGTYLCEIPGRGETPVQHHMYEEMLLVLTGSGVTTIWNAPDAAPHSFEWKQGSIFALPLNAHYQHFNVTSEPTRFVSVTTAPAVMNLFHNDEFVFDNPFVFTDRYDGDEAFFNGDGKMSPGRLWETNFVPDAYSFPLQEWKERGANSRNILLEIGTGSTLASHISEFDVGTYKKAHRHGRGAHVIILTGHGYSLLWPEGEEPVRCEWGPGSLIVPPEQWYHQHFNTSSEPSRYMALRWSGSRYFPLAKKSWGIEEGVNQINYEDEDPKIHELFVEELAKSNTTSRMESFFTPQSA